MKLIMNQSGQLGHRVGSIITGGVFTIISQPSIKVKIDGAGVYRGPLQYVFAGGSSAGFDPGTVATTAPQVINPSAAKVKVDGLSVILEGDFGVLAAQGTVAGVPTPIAGQAEIASAGQTKVSAR